MTDGARTRRAPPPFRLATVLAVAPVTPRLTRVTLGGEELVGFPVPEPAGSVRLLLPEPTGLEIPTWAGNNFVLASGARPTLRTLTPVATDPARRELSLEVVRHGAGRAAEWAAAARPGDPSAISGPARGYVPSAEAERFVFAGDETAIPALLQLVAAAPGAVPVELLVEVAEPAARLPIPDRAGLTVRWIETGREPAGVAPPDAFVAVTIEATTHVWAGGEAAAMQRIRRHLFETLGVERARATVRGYWKFGRGASAEG